LVTDSGAQAISAMIPNSKDTAAKLAFEAIN
jgi:hypothetical protein